MKTTVEIPDLLYRDAKVMASRQGISIKQLLTEAVRDRLRRQAGGRVSRRGRRLSAD